MRSGRIQVWWETPKITSGTICLWFSVESAYRTFLISGTKAMSISTWFIFRMHLQILWTRTDTIYASFQVHGRVESYHLKDKTRAVLMWIVKYFVSDIGVIMSEKSLQLWQTKSLNCHCLDGESLIHISKVLSMILVLAAAIVSLSFIGENHVWSYLWY